MPATRRSVLARTLALAGCQRRHAEHAELLGRREQAIALLERVAAHRIENHIFDGCTLTADSCKTRKIGMRCINRLLALLGHERDDVLECLVCNA